ncbi:MAG: hypothetical protein ACI4KG_01980 [Oscillospiraceae bacterium]
MTVNPENSVVCPICKNSFEAESPIAKCPVCGYTASAETLIEKSKAAKNSGEDVELYRLMSSADAFFSKKSYDEAYIGYSAVLDRDGACLKADFRRELTSNYLMLETSSAYLNCDGFFSKVEEMKERINSMDGSDPETKKLKLMICRDVTDYISFRSDYEKKYASAHKNSKTVEVYMTNIILLFEYTADVIKYLNDIDDDSIEKNRAYLIIDCCSLGMKLKGMLLAGAEYIETSEKMNDLSNESSAKNVSRIKRRMLSQDDEIHIETISGKMQKAKDDMLASVSKELYAEIKASEAKSEEQVEKTLRDDDAKRAEYEQWRRRNEEEYIAADKKILIFGIAGKAALVLVFIMLLVFVIELIAFDTFIKGILMIAAFFVAVNIACDLLKKSAEKKKGFYSKVIEGDSANIRSSGGGFDR